MFGQRDSISYSEAKSINQGMNMGGWWRAQEFAYAYLAAAVTDLESFYADFFRASRALNSEYPNDEILFELDCSTSYAAGCQFAEESETNGLVTISLGSSLALDDLFFRLASCRTFFARKKLVLNGFKQLPKRFDCVWPERKVRWLGGANSDVLIPSRRFDTYGFSPLTKKGRAWIESGSGSFLSRFFSAIPIEKTRFDTARLMSSIAHGWLFLHEETHFAEGHLGYRKIAKLGVAPFTEVDINDSTVEKFTARKVMEWHADDGATTGIVDFVLQNMMEMLGSLERSSDSADDDEVEILRLILTTIGTVMLHFRFLEVTHGQSERYPSANTRLTTLCYAVLKAISSRKWLTIDRKNFAQALLVSIEDWIAVSEILGVQLISGRAGIPLEEIDSGDGKGQYAELGIFDERVDQIYFALKISRELGFEYPSDLFREDLGEIEVSPFGAVENSYDRKWISEYRQIVGAFNGHFINEFKCRRPTSWGAKREAEFKYSKSGDIWLATKKRVN